MNIGNLKNALANFTVNFRLPPITPDDKKVPVDVVLTPNKSALVGFEQKVRAMVEPEHVLALANGMMQRALMVVGRSVVEDVLKIVCADCRVKIIRAEQSLMPPEAAEDGKDEPTGGGSTIQ